jgi:hypothetical protein
MKQLISLSASALICMAALYGTPAMADDSAPAAAPKHECQQPVIPMETASDVVRKYFEKKHKKYSECITKFVDEQSAIAKNSTDVAKANQAHDAAEAAIKEYNDFMAILTERETRMHENDPAQ